MNKNELENNENEQPEQTPVKKKLVLNKRTIVSFVHNQLKNIRGGQIAENKTDPKTQVPPQTDSCVACVSGQDMVDGCNNHN